MVTPNFLFWIPRVLTKIYVLRIVLNRAKITVVVSFADRKPEYLEKRRTYAQ